MLALIIEDDAGLRLIYRRVLEDLGYGVREAADGMEALELLDLHTPDLIFLDMLLPKISGVTVLNHITTTPKLRSVHIVIVSSNQQFEKLAHSDLDIDFVLKPIRPAQIRELALRR
jgi:CheY-like chemotaxis protein